MIKRVDNGGLVHLVTNIRKPRKWRRYEYLQQTSSALYIDTGYCPNTMTTDMLLTFLNLQDSKVIAGVAVQIWNTSFCFSTGTVSGTNISCYLLYNGVTNVGTFNINTKYTFSYKGNTVNYNGTIKTKERIDLSIPYSIYLFRLNNHLNSSTYAPSNLKIYNFKLWEAGTLVRDMVPAEYNGEYGMWDLVEDKFYGNAGTGSFTVGPEIKNYDEIDEVRRAGSILPAGVELYDYILSSGTLWIDSGVKADLYPFKLEIEFMNHTSSGEKDVWGNINSSLGDKYGFVSGVNALNFFQWGGSSWSKAGATVNQWHVVTYEYPDANNRNMIADGNSYTIATSNNNIILSNSNIYLFSDGPRGNMKFNGKIKYAKIYVGNVLRRNMIPCIYLGEPGMWDTVENKFYRNQGTGQFTLGNKITLKEYEYLLSSGTLYIDTLYNPNNNTRVLTELMMTTNGDAQGMFGSYSGNNWTDRSYGLYYAGSSGNAYSNYVSDTVFPRSKIPYNIKHLIDKNKNLLYIDNTLVLTHSTATFQASISMHIFKLNFSSLPRYANMRLYTFKIWDNNTLVRDFIPVSYNGTPGLWDKVEWKFYANAGSGSFTLGPEKASGIYPVWREVTIEDTFTFKLTPKVKRNIATLLGIKGNSIAWNLLINNNNFPSSISINGISGTSDTTKGSIKFTGSCSKYTVIYIGNSNIPVILNHKYLFIGTPTGAIGANATTGNYDYRISIDGNYYLTVLNEGRIWTSDKNSTINCYIRFNTGAQNINVTFYPRLFDLTLIYGYGNEPSSVDTFIQDCYKWFGKHPCSFLYDTGSIKAVKSNELKSVGFNQQSENMELGRYALDTGTKYDLNNCIRISNPIKVFPNTNYYIHNPYVNSNYYLWVLYLDNDDKLIEKINGNNNYIGPENIITTTPVNASKLIFYIYGTTNYNNDVCINLSNSKLNGTYRPYNSQTISIPVTSITGKLNGSGNSVVIFPNGMKSTGDRWDEIYVELGVTKAIKRIGSIDMGSANNLVLRANFSTTGDCYINGFGSAKGIPGIRLVTCSKFSSMPTYSNLISSMSEYVAAEKDYKTVNFRVKDHTLTREQVKEYITGTILYYELELYLEYIVDNFTLPQLFGVELGGTEEIKSDTISVAPTLLINYTI